MDRDLIAVEAVVPTTPERAFEVFTGEIDRWWRRTSRFRWLTRGGTLAFVDGRLIEQVDDTRFEVGPVLAWQPGRHLAFGWRPPSVQDGGTTRVDVWFEACEHGTRVRLEHSGWAALRRDDPARKGTGGTPALQGLWGLWWSELLGSLARQLRAGPSPR